MFTQREMDTALVEGKAEVQKLLEEWVTDYLGSRLDGIDTRGDETEGAQAQSAEGPDIAQQTQAPY
jgi:hypothetical protein